jgi:hypothetical protein
MIPPPTHNRRRAPVGLTVFNGANGPRELNTTAGQGESQPTQKNEEKRSRLAER